MSMYSCMTGFSYENIVKEKLVPLHQAADLDFMIPESLKITPSIVSNYAPSDEEKRVEEYKRKIREWS